MQKSRIPVVISSVPWTATDSLLMAPGVLKSCLTEIGIQSRALDLNQRLRKRIDEIEHKEKFLQFLMTEELASEVMTEVKKQFNWMADELLEADPDWICLSLLTYLSQISCKWLCFLIKRRKPQVKIVIGGPGCFSSLKGMDSFAMSLRRQKLIDYFVTGDGERALQALIQGDENYPGINSSSWKELKNLDDLPMPDYTDYDMSIYKIPSVSILGSRGCVRDCTFCDIHEHWQKFQWRSAQSIFEEMVHQYQTYGIRIFRFADSLINGNQKEYRKLIRLLADFNNSRPESQRLAWTSFFIFRPRTQMAESDWELTAQSGAIMLTVGVESFVEHIRYHIKKKFDNQDLDYSLRMGQKYQIPMSLLILVGYPTETQKDHEDQLEWIRNNRHYAGNPVRHVNLGSTMAVLPNTWVDRNKSALKIEITNKEVYQDWVIPGVSTAAQRLAWHAEMRRVLIENGFDAVVGEENHVLIERYLNRGR